MTVIQTDLENHDNSFSTEDLIYQESSQYNYIGLQFGSLPLVVNDDVIFEGGNIYFDRNWNYFHVIQTEKNNQLEGSTYLYLKREDEDFNWNVATFDGSIGMTVKDDLVYIYGSTRFTDSLFVKDEFIKSIPGGGAFILTFNEDLELIDDFFYGLNFNAKHGDVKVEIGSNRDYHIAGRFFTNTTDDFDLEVGGEVISPIQQGFETQTFYYVIVDHETKQARYINSFGGIYNDQARLHDFKINDEDNALILFDQSDELQLNGQMLENNPDFLDVSLLCLYEDSLKYYVNYEGPAAQTGHLIEKLDNNFTYEYLRSRGGVHPFIINQDSIYFDSLQNHLIINRNPNGEIEWMQNIQGPAGGSDIFDIALSKDHSTLWLSGTLKTGFPFLIDNQELLVENRFGGFLLGLDAVTGEFINVLYPVMESDEGISPYTTMPQIHEVETGKLKILSRLGFATNILENTYDYSIGDLTIPVAGKGELVLFDLDPDFAVATNELIDTKNNIYPNPITPGQIIHLNNSSKKSFTLYSTIGEKIGKVNNNSSFPSIPDGLYWLESEDRTIFQLIVQR